MSIQKFLLAFTALAIIMLVGCREPVGLPGNRVRAATVQDTTCYVAGNTYCGHVDWYQGFFGRLWDHYGFGYTITRAHNLYPISPPTIAWPHKEGFCIFTVPHFEASGGVVACTLYYYQTSHSGTASLLVNSWTSPLDAWPPSPLNDSTLNLLYWQISDSYDTVATDSTHSADNSWYKIALTPEAYNAIADTAGAYPDGDGWFRTGWVYRDSVDGTYTDVSGYDGYDHQPYIKIWYNE